MPDRAEIHANRYLKPFARILDDPHIFHLTRRSAAGGVAAGAFIAFLPVPGHMLLATIAAIWLRVNLPLALALVWITNPLTMGPVFYLEYRLGAAILDKPFQHIDFEMTLAWFSGTALEIWPSLIVGGLIFAVSTSTVAYLLIKLLWRLAVIQKWEKRKQRKKGLGLGTGD